MSYFDSEYSEEGNLFSEDKKDVIYNKATWKTPFAKRHCIVPVSQFIEPIYTGEFSGNMVKFGSTKDEMLFAAGIWDTWIDKQSGEVLDSFAIITNDPPKFVEETGHDRCPIFLEGTALEAWLHSESKSPQDWVEFLKKESSEVELKASVFRPMAKGWEKRA